MINEKRQFDCIVYDSFSSTIENEVKNELRIDKLQRKENEKEIVASMHERNDAISTNWTKAICYRISKIVWKWFSTLDVYDFVNCRESFFYNWRLISNVEVIERLSQKNKKRNSFLCLLFSLCWLLLLLNDERFLRIEWTTSYADFVAERNENWRKIEVVIYCFFEELMLDVDLLDKLNLLRADDD